MTKIPLILGRPFLAVSRVVIDVVLGELVLKCQDKKVTFNDEVNEQRKKMIKWKDL